MSPASTGCLVPPMAHNGKGMRTDFSLFWASPPICKPRLQYVQFGRAQSHARPTAAEPVEGFL